jgi:citrate synthase
MSEVLFEVRDDNLESGLRGVPVGYCTTSRVDPDKGLHYRGKSVREFAHLRPEEVIYCIMEGSFDGESPGFKGFSEALQKKAKLNPKVKEFICKLPKESHPMKLLQHALTFMATFESKGNYPEDCVGVIAKIPEVVAILINYHAGWGDTKESDPKLGYIENFCHMLNVPNVKNKEVFVEVMRLFNVLHYDHGGGNLSTFVGKAVASSHEDMYSSLAASMCALEGPLHGKANQVCLAFIEEIYKEAPNVVTGDQMEDLIRKRLKEGKLLYGFGHAVLRKEDTRATLLAEAGEKYFKDHPLVHIALLLRERGPKVLMENPKIKDPYANVDLMSGAILAAAGFPYPEYFTVLFGLARVVGIARQIVYERCEARGGKGTPIIRPKYLYKAA